jgi:hypothetical protein
MLPATDHFELILAEDVPLPVMDTQRSTEVQAGLTTPPLLPLVNYYTQAATGGTYTSAADYGSATTYSVLLEPLKTTPNGKDPVVTPHDTSNGRTSFSLFVVAYDSSNALMGIGTYQNGSNTKIEIKPDAAYKYTDAPIVLESVHRADLSAVADGSAALVTCGSGSASFTSGLVWQPDDANTPQVRILFPDTAAIAGSTSAEGRALDLDCDGVPAMIASGGSGSADCDDLLASVAPRSAPSCGVQPLGVADPNCGTPAPPLATCMATGVTCTGSAGSSSGTQVCDTDTGDLGCAANPTCACGSATNAAGCLICYIHFTTSGGPGLTPCRDAPEYLEVPTQYAGDVVMASFSSGSNGYAWTAMGSGSAGSGASAIEFRPMVTPGLSTTPLAGSPLADIYLELYKGNAFDGFIGVRLLAGSAIGCPVDNGFYDCEVE